MDRAWVRSRAQNTSQGPSDLRQGSAIEIEAKRGADDRFWLPHSRKLAVVEELVAAGLAFVELLALLFPVLHYPGGAAPLTSIPPGRSFIGEPPVPGVGGTAGFDARNIDLSGPLVLVTPAAPPSL